ncbi:hypothetical protein PanWU01x14_178680, partial [Parasponia andersonii]
KEAFIQRRQKIHKDNTKRDLIGTGTKTKPTNERKRKASRIKRKRLTAFNNLWELHQRKHPPEWLTPPESHSAGYSQTREPSWELQRGTTDTSQRPQQLRRRKLQFLTIDSTSQFTKRETSVIA